MLTDADAGDSRHATSRLPPPMMMYICLSSLHCSSLLVVDIRGGKKGPVCMVLEALRLKIEEVQS